VAPDRPLMAASRERSGGVGVLYGEFTDAADWQVRYSVSLTDSCLTVQQITSSPSQDELALSLGDCVGSRAHRERNGADQGACFSAYFYPNVPRRRSSGTARQRVERCFRVALAEDARANLAEAERWARAVRQRGLFFSLPLSLSLSLSLSLFLPYLPPSLSLFLSVHSPPPFSLCLSSYFSSSFSPEHQNHARELVRSADLSECSALVILSGDGLLFEVINGLMEREDWEQAILTPLAILPGGSGNALAASVGINA
uniref:DAGKc domain-containing protein n=1 Tax=Electrophorus electricus TaxID=8005 RepID=A0A4W4FEL2_ELEEL